jgi:histone H1/5
MADTVATPKKKTTTKVKKPAADHPKYIEMVSAAIAALKERGGSSRQAILKYIMTTYNVGADAKKVNARVKVALRAGVTSAALKQAKGTGASGSFRLGEVKKAAPKKVKKPKAAKPKKVKTPKKAAKKPAGEKKAKSPKKVKKAKAPAPAATKKAAAKPKKAKTPKKAAAKPKTAKPKKVKTPKKKAAAKPKKA